MTLVIFHDNGGHILDPLLKQGFRHCFCVVNDGTYWIEINGKAGGPEIRVVAGSDYNLRRFYEGEGFTVIEAVHGDGAWLPLVLSNCVGVAKTVLGLSAPFVFTPYQLYRRLTK